MKDIREVVSFVGESISAAAGNIAANRLRSCITAAIIAIGVASLVGTQASIESLSSLLSGAFGGKDCNSFTISPSSANIQARLSRSRLLQFGEMSGKAESMSVYSYILSPDAIRGPLGPLPPGTIAVAFDGDYLRANALGVNLGREFSPLEVSSGSKVCLVGQKVAGALAEGSPIGQTLTISGQCFKVTGTINEDLSFLGVIAGNTIYVPLQSVWNTLLSDSCNFNADVMFSPDADAGEEAADADEIMRRTKHASNLHEPDFEISQNDALRKEVDSLGGKLSIVALVVGMLTILGAAVGLTNIMLIAIKERTREIGLRRATGATRSAIVLNLLTESALICSHGCCAGILLGLAVGNILSAVLGTPLQIPWGWICTSCMVCAAVCFAAGWIPARRAASMDPVAALRCE